MEKKYKLTEETINIDDVTLYRIEALKDFGDIQKGDKGGFVENEDNLSQEGDCWVYDAGKVYGKASLCAAAKRINNDSSEWKYMGILSWTWFVGVVLLLGYAAIRYLRFRKNVQASIRIRDGIYVCDNIRTPFILGVIRPGIYLPSDMDEVQTDNVIAHERAHLSRLDQVWKPLGFYMARTYLRDCLLDAHGLHQESLGHIRHGYGSFFMEKESFVQLLIITVEKVCLTF